MGGAAKRKEKGWTEDEDGAGKVTGRSWKKEGRGLERGRGGVERGRGGARKRKGGGRKEKEMELKGQRRLDRG
jgi:hypothetical protein